MVTIHYAVSLFDAINVTQFDCNFSYDRLNSEYTYNLSFTSELETNMRPAHTQSTDCDFSVTTSFYTLYIRSVI